jgi:hypothetical protein
VTYLCFSYKYSDLGFCLLIGVRPLIESTGGLWVRPLSQMLTSVKDISGINQPAYFLEQNYPNPFNPSTAIKFSIPKTTHVTLNIYNSLGQEVANLISKDMNPGNYTTEWNASRFASGVYYYRMVAGDFVQTKKLILLK